MKTKITDARKAEEMARTLRIEAKTLQDTPGKRYAGEQLAAAVQQLEHDSLVRLYNILEAAARHG